MINCRILLQGSSQSGPVLTPAEVLIAIHGIDPEKDGIALKKVGSDDDWFYALGLFNEDTLHNWGVYMQVTDACNACFEQRQTFTQEVLARVLNQLVCYVEIVLYIWNAYST